MKNLCVLSVILFLTSGCYWRLGYPQHPVLVYEATPDMPKVRTAEYIPSRPEVMQAPPQYWGWLYSPPLGCEGGPLTLEITNTSRYFVMLKIDGKRITLPGTKEPVLIAPRENLFLCLAHTGEHVIEGVGMSDRFGRGQVIDEFRKNVLFGANVVPNVERHRFYIETATFQLY